MIESLHALSFNEKATIVIGFIAACIALLQYIHQRKQKTAKANEATITTTSAEQVVAAQQISGNAIANKQSFEASELSQPVFVEGNSVNIHNGVPVEQYRQDVREYKQNLEKKEQEIRELIKQNTELQHSSTTSAPSDPNNAQRQHELATELAAVQQKLQNTESSYQQYIQELQERIKRLEALKGQLPDNVIDAAKQALQNGDNEQADQLFAKVQEQAEAPIKVAAEASFQRAKIAKDNIDYHNALAHYERAAQLAPENTHYLDRYATMLQTMGNINKAIDYFEQALLTELKNHGEDHPEVATYLNNLGEAWRQKGELDKAIGYYEQALASDINNYGEHHPKVATRRNNLGSAWQDKGLLDKAITYYEQALASDINTYGEHHPSVARGRNNLGGAWRQKGELDKAIECLQLAFDGFRNVYGDEHPSTQTVKANLEVAERTQLMPLALKKFTKWFFVVKRFVARFF